MRPRPLQHRLLRVARAADAAAVQEERRLRANRLGRRVRAVGEGHRERDRRIGRAGRSDRRRPADQRRSVRAAARVPRDRRRTISTGAPVRSVKRRPARTADRSSTLENAKVDRHCRRVAGGTRAGALAAHPQGACVAVRGSFARPPRRTKLAASAGDATPRCAGVGRRRISASAASIAQSVRDRRATYITGEQGNARGAEAMGMFPNSARATPRATRDAMPFAMFDAARDGKLTVLSLFGVNPALLRTGRSASARGAARLPFVGRQRPVHDRNGAARDARAAGEGRVRKDTVRSLNLAGDLLPVERVARAARRHALRSRNARRPRASSSTSSFPSDRGSRRERSSRTPRPQRRFRFGDERFATAAPSAPPSAKTIFSGGGTSKYDIRLEALRTASALDAAVDVPRRPVRLR